MIGSGLKKLASENNMHISNGVAYGALRGYAATLSEGSDYKLIVFSVKFKDPTMKTQFLDTVSGIGDKELYKRYRVRNLGVSAGTITILFHDTIGTMKKIRECLDWIIPQLEKWEASKAEHCAHCGAQIEGGQWVMIDGACHHVHPSCADILESKIHQSNEDTRQSRTGSYVSGVVGAFLGAALGAVVWAFVLLAGYVASIVGLLIGWLADKGYGLLGGKQGRAKIVILILAIIFGVVAGTLAADIVSIVEMINNGELPGMVYRDIPYLMGILFEDAEYISAMTKNLLLGFLFAGLGVFAMLRNAGKAVADVKFKRLG